MCEEVRACVCAACVALPADFQETGSLTANCWDVYSGVLFSGRRWKELSPAGQNICQQHSEQVAAIPDAPHLHNLPDREELVLGKC